jgi:hydrogenase maturation protease
MARTLIAGFGNELRGDDGFGIEVVRRLQRKDLGPDVHVIEIGTAGLQLVQHLLDAYDRLIIVDAIARGGAAGSIIVLAVDDVAASHDAGDMHLAVPSRALAMARGIGALPAKVFIVGCEPGCVDELITELSADVRAAVDEAITQVQRLLPAAVTEQHG